jgi:hypothetical protein
MLLHISIQPLLHFSFPFMHEAIGVAVFGKQFFQNISASPRELLIKL